MDNSSFTGIHVYHRSTGYREPLCLWNDKKAKCVRVLCKCRSSAPGTHHTHSDVLLLRTSYILLPCAAMRVRHDTHLYANDSDARAPREGFPRARPARTAALSLPSPPPLGRQENGGCCRREPGGPRKNDIRRLLFTIHLDEPIPAVGNRHRWCFCYKDSGCSVLARPALMRFASDSANGKLPHAALPVWSFHFVGRIDLLQPWSPTR